MKRHLLGATNRAWTCASSSTWSTSATCSPSPATWRTLEIAWKDAEAVYLSFDIDVIDAGLVPGTGWPEPGGLLPREALNLVRLVSEPGLAGIEIVECSPPCDWAETTCPMSSRVVLDSLAAQVRAGKPGREPSTSGRPAWGPYPS